MQEQKTSPKSETRMMLQNCEARDCLLIFVPTFCSNFSNFSEIVSENHFLIFSSGLFEIMYIIEGISQGVNVIMTKYVFIA